ncbi:MAG TPA: hypothetical protein VD996_14510 [Chitinophagaceae bacterium]|nr:hypothetical protein [Chitinophagaceae bacterium]
MKKLHSNEKHLADKLRHVPVPDVDQSWEQMKELLEREMPKRPVAAWSGNRKWYWMGVTAGLIMLSLWLTQELNQQHSQVAETKNAAKSNTETTSTEAKNAEAKNSEATRTINEAQRPEAAKTEQLPAAGSTFNQQNKVSTVTIPANSTSANTTNEKTFTSTNASGASHSLTTTRTNKQTNASQEQENITGSITRSNTTNIPPTITNTLREAEASDTYMSLIDDNNSINTLSGIQPPSTFEDVKQAVPGKTDKAFAREMRQKSMKKDNRRMSRSSMRGNFGDEGREITFAAGLALPQSIAISGQQASSYNINGKTNRIADYLPAPFFQYHLNNKLFLQTEFHFQSPQYTDRLLLRNTSRGDSMTMLVTNSIYLEKLYYFNIPVNVYYTPVRNVSVGGGLQYSSFVGGVASYEEKRITPQTSTMQSVTQRFRDDSLASRFAPSEWRYQFDANYYLNRFTLGVRYTQAMKDFLNVRPATVEGSLRNRSFLLYLRFNIWEERKKGGAYSAYNW